MAHAADLEVDADLDHVHAVKLNFILPVFLVVRTDFAISNMEIFSEQRYAMAKLFFQSSANCPSRIVIIQVVFWIAASWRIWFAAASVKVHAYKRSASRSVNKHVVESVANPTAQCCNAFQIDFVRKLFSIRSVEVSVIGSETRVVAHYTEHVIAALEVITDLTANKAAIQVKVEQFAPTLAGLIVFGIASSIAAKATEIETFPDRRVINRLNRRVLQRAARMSNARKAKRSGQRRRRNCVFHFVPHQMCPKNHFHAQLTHSLRWADERCGESRRRPTNPR